MSLVNDEEADVFQNVLKYDSMVVGPDRLFVKISGNLLLDDIKHVGLWGR